MKKFPVEFSPQAIGELDEIFNYLVTQAGIETALKIDKEIQYFCLEKLAFFPEMGVQRDYIEKGIRFFAIGSYGLYYFFDGEKIKVVHILHRSRDVKNNF